MTRDEVIRIAREVYGQDTEWRGTLLLRLEALARKYMMVEREACAQVAEQAGVQGYGTLAAAHLIRERGKHE